VETRTLQFLVEARREAVDDRTRYVNRLTAQLKMFFPQLLEWFDNVDSVIVNQLLRKWPTLEQLQQAKPIRVAEFLRKHRVPDARVEILQQAIETSIPATKDCAVIEVSMLIVKRLVLQLEALREAIKEHDEQIASRTASHPDVSIFSSLPGAGPVMVPRLIAAFGTQRQRYATASEIQCYSGIAPVTASSCKQKWIHWRWACPKFLRQTFHEWAWLSTRKSEWARAYYSHQRDKGKSHHGAVRALAFKWLRIVFRCWQEQLPYDEARYTQAVHRRAASSPVEIRLKNRSGFNKLDGLSS
jgi:hypothetical protein